MVDPGLVFAVVVAFNGQTISLDSIIIRSSDDRKRDIGILAKHESIEATDSSVCSAMLKIGDMVILTLQDQTTRP